MLTYHYRGSGYTGKAYTGTLCSKRAGSRTGVTEYYKNDIQTSLWVAHEIGHNLGMYHDFTKIDGERVPRQDSNGNICKQGAMDYGNDRYSWSQCSVEDFTKLYQKHNSDFCLKEREPGM